VRKKAVKEINLKAQLECNGITLDGSISIMDGLFKPSAKKYFFVAFGDIKFEYDGKEYSFPFTNLGGKYFVKDYKNNSDYQRIATIITLNETLEVQPEKKSNPKIKI
jgi:hypothetical protein